MSPLVVLIFLTHLTYSIRADAVYKNNRHLLDILPQGEVRKDVKPEVAKPHHSDEVHIDVVSKNNGKVPAEVKEAPHEIKNIKTVKTTQAPVKNESKVDEHQPFKPSEMESGALLRGVAVVVVLTMLVIIYMALKTYCRTKSKRPVMVSKYGVRTRRSDIEMTPLPLDEDDDDETLFEVNNTNR